MSKVAIIQKLEQKQLKTDIPHFAVGDTISVHLRIIEGEKERIQVFTGTVIARKGSGSSETISLHRIAYGEGMERVFILHSPRIAKIELVKQGRVRRSKLYYLRGTSGEAAKVKRREGTFRKEKEEAPVLDKEEVVQAEAKEVKADAQPESVTTQQEETSPAPAE